MAFQENEEEVRWFVMRDLKRTNAKLPAYKLLDGKKMEDLLFVHETRKNLDAVVKKTPTLQFRWLRNTWREPMVVVDADMERFIRAVNATESPKYYLPEEITPAMYGRRIRIVGGPLNEYEGSLLTTRGSKVKRLLVELKGFLAVGVEVDPEYIQLI